MHRKSKIPAKVRSFQRYVFVSQNTDGKNYKRPSVKSSERLASLIIMGKPAPLNPSNITAEWYSWVQGGPQIDLHYAERGPFPTVMQTVDE